MRFLFCLFFFVSFSVHAEESESVDRPHTSRWEEDIQKFEKADLESPPTEGGIVFIGSSSIRMWNLSDSFPDRKIVNRGFGGSWIQDSTAFAERILLPHRPRVIALYAGDNDIAGGLKAEEVFEDYQVFASWVREHLPDTHLIYIAIKPSISRWTHWPEMKEANEMMRERTAKEEREHFADISLPMLGEEDELNPDHFLDDNLHLSEEGYAIWTEVLSPLVEELAGEE